MYCDEMELLILALLSIYFNGYNNINDDPCSVSGNGNDSDNDSDNDNDSGSEVNVVLMDYYPKIVKPIFHSLRSFLVGGENDDLNGLFISSICNVFCFVLVQLIMPYLSETKMYSCYLKLILFYMNNEFSFCFFCYFN
jgi:hypothetical protein